MCDPPSGDRELSQLDRRVLGCSRSAGEERRRRRRRPFFAIQRIAPYDGLQTPDAADFFCVESRDLTSQGMSFLLDGRPGFQSLVVALCEPPNTVYVAARVVHCTDVLVNSSGLVEPIHDTDQSDPCHCHADEQDQPMVLVGCEFTGRIEAGDDQQQAPLRGAVNHGN